MLVPERPT